MLRNLFLLVLFLLLVHVTSAVALPKCPGYYHKATWHNCEGIIDAGVGGKIEAEYNRMGLDIHSTKVLM